ncbi:hypothetical protein UES5a001 [Escherichia phage UE-S5a]
MQNSSILFLRRVSVIAVSSASLLTKVCISNLVRMACFSAIVLTYELSIPTALVAVPNVSATVVAAELTVPSKVPAVIRTVA